MEIKNRTSYKISAFFCLLLVFVSGCVDTSEVVKFAATTKAASQQFPALAQDFPQSNIRRYEYDIRSLERPSTNALSPEAIRKQAIQKANDPLPGSHGELSETDEQNLVATNAVLAEYVDALGKLASDDVASYDKQVAALASSVQKTTLFDEKKVDAVKGLSIFLANAVADNWRKKKLASVISSQDQNIQTITLGLKEIVGPRYTRQLDLEKSAMDAYYGGIVKDLKVPDPLPGSTTSPVVLERGALIENVEETWNQKSLDLQKRRAGAQGYLTVLSSIAATHRKLCESGKKLGSREVRGIITNYAKDLEPAVAAFREAFKTQLPTPTPTAPPI